MSHFEEKTQSLESQHLDSDIQIVNCDELELVSGGCILDRWFKTDDGPNVARYFPCLFD